MAAHSVCVAVFFCVVGVCTSQDRLCDMTPMTLESDFISSCNGRTNCTQAWTIFRDTFAGRTPQSVTPSSYDPYFDFIPIEAMDDQSLFWTRTQSLVEILSMMNAMGVKVVSSFNTLSSDILNGISPTLRWCGNENGIDFDNPCLCNVTNNFWHQFSAEFGRAASGNTFYLADGEDKDGAYRNDSFFATVELPNMRDDVVTRLVALLVHRKGEGESCSEGESIKQLKEVVEGRNFSFDCYDIFAQASNNATTAMTAECLRKVIDDVQMDMEGKDREIECDGSIALRVSIIGLLASFFAVFLLK